MQLSRNLDENIKEINKILPIKKSFDIIGRGVTFGETKGYITFVDGFAKDDIMLWLLDQLQDLTDAEASIDGLQRFIDKHIGYIEVETFQDFDTLQLSVLSGAVALVLDGQKDGIIIDARTYPARGPEEPDLEKVTRGSRDGLVETVVFNTALIRRRVRDARLIFEMKTVGKRSKTDVSIGYIADMVDDDLLTTLHEKIDRIQVDALLMAEKSLEELIIKKKWFNPMPQVRFTERPDVVAAHLLEGHIAIIVDTSPSVMLLPTTFFHFTQHSEDYYQNPLVGTYTRWIRFLSIIIATVLSPLWLMFAENPSYLPDSLAFIGPKEVGNIPIFIQFIILELGLDMLRMASIHTPNTLSTSLGIIGGLILSQFAVDVGWFIPETILYMAITGICTFATPSIEFAMAIRLFRLFLLLLTGIFGLYGFLAGLIIILLIIVTTKTFSGIHYTWPLFPLNAKALSHVMLRKPIIEIKRNSKKFHDVDKLTKK
ncbi:spore germination protein [Vallitalea pronyensis]|uniref:Spore germination protein n=1 Tax=Vallitalea pronyensis TaxID=1348613 RepID=A0A8J8SHM4_9FIRM|nr:spore germination protein [Vallitalea pronyensis]QUI23548.1 spore germination protein [Vallitalea pronyensis]